MLATSPVLSAAALGVVAGLSVAVPVGPVAVLIVREGLVRGRRAGVAAAAGVATVDLTYAMLAVLLGAQVSRLLAGWEQGLRVGGAVVLALVGIVGLVRWWRSRGAAGPDALAAGPDEPAGSSVRAARVWGRFVVITLLNPATALIFATVAVGLAGRLVAGPGRSSRSRSAPARPRSRGSACSGSRGRGPGDGSARGGRSGPRRSGRGSWCCSPRGWPSPDRRDRRDRRAVRPADVRACTSGHGCQ